MDRASPRRVAEPAGRASARCCGDEPAGMQTVSHYAAEVLSCDILECTYVGLVCWRGDHRE